MFPTYNSLTAIKRTIHVSSIIIGLTSQHTGIKTYTQDDIFNCIRYRMTDCLTLFIKIYEVLVNMKLTVNVTKIY
jgi:hypothetical protein